MNRLENIASKFSRDKVRKAALITTAVLSAGVFASVANTFINSSEPSPQPPVTTPDAPENKFSTPTFTPLPTLTLEKSLPSTAVTPIPTLTTNREVFDLSKLDPETLYLGKSVFEDQGQIRIIDVCTHRDQMHRLVVCDKFKLNVNEVERITEYSANLPEFFPEVPCLAVSPFIPQTNTFLANCGRDPQGREHFRFATLTINKGIILGEEYHPNPTQ